MTKTALRQIICRRKDLNARGRGEQETRRVRLPDGEHGWASDLAINIEGNWSSGSFRASERYCCQRGYFPPGTLIVAFDRTIGRGNSPAKITAGILLTQKEQPGTNKIRWGLPVQRKGRGADTVVKVEHEGEWLEV